ncbi:hypothetical protein, partial [Streptomyces sp. NPDC007205]|uniref:hypothetical protein n=1 Tax=Streptomyces sp. NPDC007205 TaxID=3154316 RepID=UPI0033D89CC6
DFRHLAQQSEGRARYSTGLVTRSVAKLKSLRDKGDAWCGDGDLACFCKPDPRPRKATGCRPPAFCEGGTADRQEPSFLNGAARTGLWRVVMA